MSEDTQCSQEMTLAEIIGTLPSCHLARKQYNNLLSRVSDWTVEEAEFAYADTPKAPVPKRLIDKIMHNIFGQGGAG